MVDNTNKLNTQYNFAIPTTQEEREKIILLAVKMLTEKEGGNITLNQLLSYVDNNLNNLSNEVAQALINKSNNGHNHDDRYYTEDEVNTKVNQLKSDLVAKSDVLTTLKQIQETTDLTGKIAGASALKETVTGINIVSNNYVKFNSGLLICYGSVGTYVDSGPQTFNLTFPYPFIKSPIIVVTPVIEPNKYNLYKLLVNIDNYSNTGFSCIIGSFGEGYINGSFYIAIGKWK